MNTLEVKVGKLIYSVYFHLAFTGIQKRDMDTNYNILT